jgi:hypothetical protein
MSSRDHAQSTSASLPAANLEALPSATDHVSPGAEVVVVGDGKMEALERLLDEQYRWPGITITFGEREDYLRRSEPPSWPPQHVSAKRPRDPALDAAAMAAAEAKRRRKALKRAAELARSEGA